MSWHAEWDGLSRRVRSLEQSTRHVYDVTDVYHPALAPLIQELLHPQACETFGAFQSFATRWSGVLPPAAASTLARLLAASTQHGIFAPGNGAEGWRVAGARAIAALSLLCGELDALLTDHEQYGISVAERAWIHLQWQIIADAEVARRWRDAHAAHETKCEQLGGAHLLLHGIWAFKLDAASKQRTDLVMNEPVEDHARLRTVARALVLTEWKRIKLGDNVEAEARSARGQMRIYAHEGLAGLEIRSVRYVVLVTEKRIPELDDVVENGITYRHRIIAVAPSVPSVHAASI